MPDINAVWDSQRWKVLTGVEQYISQRTILKLSSQKSEENKRKKRAKKTIEKHKSANILNNMDDAVAVVGGNSNRCCRLKQELRCSNEKDI